MVVAKELLGVAGLVLVLAVEAPPANGSWSAEAAPGGVVAVDCPCVAAPKLAGDTGAVDCPVVAAPRLLGEAVDVAKGFWLLPVAALPEPCNTCYEHYKTKFQHSRPCIAGMKKRADFLTAFKDDGRQAQSCACVITYSRHYASHNKFNFGSSKLASGCGHSAVSCCSWQDCDSLDPAGVLVADAA